MRKAKPTTNKMQFADGGQVQPANTPQSQDAADKFAAGGMVKGFMDKDGKIYKAPDDIPGQERHEQYTNFSDWRKRRQL